MESDDKRGIGKVYEMFIGEKEKLFNPSHKSFFVFQESIQFISSSQISRKENL